MRSSFAAAKRPENHLSVIRTFLKSDSVQAKLRQAVTSHVITLGRQHTVKINDWANAHQLSLLVSVQNRREDISYEVHPLLCGPTADKDEEISFGVLIESGPLLSFPLQSRPFGFEFWIYEDVFFVRELLVPVADVCRIRVRQLPDLFQAPKDRIT